MPFDMGLPSYGRVGKIAYIVARCAGYSLKKSTRVVPDRTMIDWDDVRYFLAVARGGSVRAAAEQLGVNHSTVIRRMAQLEERLGADMFEKLPSGYRLTAAGEEVLEFADQMEASSSRRASSGSTRACAGCCG
jgi:molybdenum-dependent DNA-binding transcriptional regulator ModE